jgi:hypothetical protein
MDQLITDGQPEMFSIPCLHFCPASGYIKRLSVYYVIYFINFTKPDLVYFHVMKAASFLQWIK